MKDHIVIIGGGYAGLSAAQNAAKSLSPNLAKITVIETRKFFYHCIGATRAMVDTSFVPKVLIPYDSAFSGSDVELKFATVKDIDYNARSITCTPSSEASAADHPSFSITPQNETIVYDHLILATGSSYPSPFKPSADINSSKEIEDVLTKTAEKIKHSERILVIGGGAVGIEMAGELKAFYPDKKIMLIEKHTELISSQNVPKLSRKAKAALLKHGVELILGEHLTERFYSHQFGTKTLLTESGLEIDSDAQLVCAGMTTNIDLIKDPECLDGRFIKVKATMEIDHPSSDYNNVFVIGDASNHPTPKLAYWGMMQGAHLAESLSAKIRHGQDIKPYVEPPTEAMFLPLGPTGGVSQLPICGGIVVGDFMTRMLKSKDLLSGMFWNQLNAEMP